MSTVTYLYPGSGTNPASVTQAKNAAVQTVQVAIADADTSVVVTHNYGYDTLALARGLPLVGIESLASGGTPTALLSVTKATNTITLAKNITTSGSGGIFQVDISLPHSILMPNS
jgi:hypothetical protein